MLDNIAQAPSTCLALAGLVGNGTQGLRCKLKPDILKIEQLLVLLHQRILGLDEDADKLFLIQVIHMRHHRDTADKFRNEPELDQVLRGHLFKQGVHGQALFGTGLAAKSHGGSGNTAFHYLVQADKGTADNEEDIGCIHMQEFLLGMLASALGRHIGNGALYYFQKGLLHAFA